MTKPILAFIVALVIIFGVGWVISKVNSPAAIMRHQKNQLEQKEAEKKRNILAMDSIIKEIKYFIDSRPNPPQCFGYLSRGSAQGGPALTTVPCEAVKNLLVNGSK